MSFIFCTIVTESHLFKALALKSNLSNFNQELKILVVDKINEEYEKNVVLKLSDLPTNLYAQIAKKYSVQKDKLRWALKPVFMLHLLNHFDEVFYCDSDLFFVSNPLNIEATYKSAGIALTPHFYPILPNEKPTFFEANYRIGLFNAGFIYANRMGIKNLRWWHKCCEYEITKSYFRGLFDDQKYLDLMPVIFDNVYVFRQNGMNLAEWNWGDLTIDESNKLSNGDQLVFMHLTDKTIYKMLTKGGQWNTIIQDYLLLLKKYNPEFNFIYNRFNKREFSFFWWYLKWLFSRLINRIS